MTRIPGYQTVEEIATATGLTESAIRWHCRQGRLHRVAKHTDNLWLVPDRDARLFIAAYASHRTPSGKGTP